MPSQRYHNRLLSVLAPDARGLLRPHLEPVPLAPGQEIEKPNARIDSVYFVEVGLVSVVAQGAKDRSVDVGLIGPEGMTGSSIVLGNHRSPNSTYVQVAGSAQRIRALELRRAMQASEPMRAVFLKFVETLMIQTAHTAIANANGKIEERLARWILMAHDRLGRETLPLTHEFLSTMLGVRRAGVTEALNSLEGRGLIRATRGAIRVLDRKAIKDCAGDFYGIPEAEYRRLIG